MSEEELQRLRGAIENMKNGNLSKREKVLFILGIQAGLYSDDEVVKDLLNEIVEFCLTTDVDYTKVRDFDN